MPIAKVGLMRSAEWESSLPPMEGHTKIGNSRCSPQFMGYIYNTILYVILGSQKSFISLQIGFLLPFFNVLLPFI